MFFKFVTYVATSSQRLQITRIKLSLFYVSRSALRAVWFKAVFSNDYISFFIASYREQLSRFLYFRLSGTKYLKLWLRLFFVFLFFQRCILDGFLHFLYSRQSGTSSKTQSIREAITIMISVLLCLPYFLLLACRSIYVSSQLG